MNSRQDAVVAHRETVRVFARPGGPLAPDGPHASTQNPVWFVGGRATFKRDVLHDRLIAEYKAAHPAARRERRAIVLAGPPGAGKSTVLAEVLADGSYAAQVAAKVEQQKTRIVEATCSGGLRVTRCRARGG